MPGSSSDDVLAFIRAQGFVRPTDLEAAGFNRMWLTRLERRELIERVRRGLYVAADAEWTEHHSFAEVARQAPGGVICLLSALSFHGLTTQIPFEVWLAIDRKARVPKAMTPQVRVMRFSGVALDDRRGGARHRGRARAHLRTGQDRRRLLSLPQ